LGFEENILEKLIYILKDETFLLIWIAVLSVLAFALCLFDKYSAIAKKQRIREKTLFIVSFLGGATAMFLTMRAISHKTKHKRFMIGLPIIILIHCFLIWFFYIKNSM
jgi:uncharacterized membrane protein YsdA (DUF1294 family)